MPRKPPSSWTPDRPPGRGSAPATLGEVLVGARDFAHQRSGAAIPRDAWRSVVGERIAGRTRVGKLYKGQLTVKVASSAWSSELTFLKQQLIEKLTKAGYEVDDLRFVVDRWAREKPARSSLAKPGSPHLAPLPAELEARLAMIDDPNLRSAVTEAARHSLAREPLSPSPLSSSPLSSRRPKTGDR